MNSCCSRPHLLPLVKRVRPPESLGISLLHAPPPPPRKLSISFWQEGVRGEEILRCLEVGESEDLLTRAKEGGRKTGKGSGRCSSAQSSARRSKPSPSTPSSAQPRTRRRGESRGSVGFRASVRKQLPTAHSGSQSSRSQGPLASAPTPKSLLRSALPRALRPFRPGQPLRCRGLSPREMAISSRGSRLGRGWAGGGSVLMCNVHFLWMPAIALDALGEHRPAVPSRAVLLTFPPYLENTKVIFPFCHRLLVPGEDVRFGSARA